MTSSCNMGGGVWMPFCFLLLVAWGQHRTAQSRGARFNSCMSLTTGHRGGVRCSICCTTLKSPILFLAVTVKALVQKRNGKKSKAIKETKTKTRSEAKFPSDSCSPVRSKISYPLIQGWRPNQSHHLSSSPWRPHT